MATKLGQHRLKELREALVAKRRQLETEVGRSALYEKGLDEDATKDLGDQANTAYTREFQFELGNGDRRLLREVDSLWVFLVQHGVEPTNNRAERALRFGVLWRKRSQGTASEKGNRWVERILSLKETCRLQAQSTYTVLVDAVTKLFIGQPPDLTWLRQS